MECPSWSKTLDVFRRRQPQRQQGTVKLCNLYKSLIASVKKNTTNWVELSCWLKLNYVFIVQPKVYGLKWRTPIWNGWWLGVAPFQEIYIVSRHIRLWTLGFEQDKKDLHDVSHIFARIVGDLSPKKNQQKQTCWRLSPKTRIHQPVPKHWPRFPCPSLM